MFQQDPKVGLSSAIQSEARELSNIHLSKFLTTNQVARYLGISASSLEKARSTGKGPYAALDHVKIGRSVRYTREAIEAFVQANRIAGVNRTFKVEVRRG